jgi:hypothetical protein
MPKTTSTLRHSLQVSRTTHTTMAPRTTHTNTHTPMAPCTTYTHLWHHASRITHTHLHTHSHIHTHRLTHTHTYGTTHHTHTHLWYHSLLLRCTCSLGTPGFVRLSQPLVSCFWLRLLIHTHPETYQQLFLVLLDAFSSRFFKTNVLFLCKLFSTNISFLFPLDSVSFV